MYFDMYGPFDVARANRRVSGDQSALWQDVREASVKYEYEKNGLERAIGCYAFGLCNGQSYKPWYVGMTMAQTGFRGEIFQDHKLKHYNEVMAKHQGTPVMFLMPLLTPEGWFCRDRVTTKPLIQWTEKMLFGVAFQRNPRCRNQRDTKFLRNVTVRGVFAGSETEGQTGRPAPSVIAARNMFGT
jgi:hypothetical protein